MKLVIHRGSHEVGGSCVEISYAGSTMLVDLGLPLDYNGNETIEPRLPLSLFHTLHKDKKIINGVVLSHPHLDHYGLAGQLPAAIPIYCGRASWDLMKATARFSPNKILLPKVEHFEAWREFRIGDLNVTPYLVDHSAFDAYGFLISGGGRNVFYTGDFRGHGRKSKLIDRLPMSIPAIDCLLMEGTLIGSRSDEMHLTESALEDAFVNTMEETPGITLVTAASQNIDRLVTIFKATRRSGRMLIIDFYIAEILEILKKYARLPNATWPGIRVCYPQLLARRFEEQGLNDVLDRHRENGIRWTHINEKKGKLTMLIRPGFIHNIKRFIDLEGATWIYSMWPGYFDRSQSLQKLKSFLQEQGVRYKYLHTSGHARLDDLKEFVQKLSPKMIVPIHSHHPHQFPEHFANVKVLDDGEVLTL